MRPRLLVRPPAPRRAFTLVEMLVTLSLVGVLSIGLTSSFLQGLNAYHFDSGKLLVNRDIRAFTSELTDHATYSNYFLIYPSFEDRTRTAVSVVDPNEETVTTTETTTSAHINDGASGDFLVLVYIDPADNKKIQRLVGYYRAPAGTATEGPVRKFDRTFSPSSSSPAHELLPATSTRDSWEEVIELSRGLADGRLFYNFYDRSITVKGEIIHRGSKHRRATNTYNFTVSPRG